MIGSWKLFCRKVRLRDKRLGGRTGQGRAGSRRWGEGGGRGWRGRRGRRPWAPAAARGAPRTPSGSGRCSCAGSMRKGSPRRWSRAAWRTSATARRWPSSATWSSTARTPRPSSCARRTTVRQRPASSASSASCERTAGTSGSRRRWRARTPRSRGMTTRCVAPPAHCPAGPLRRPRMAVLPERAGAALPRGGAVWGCARASVPPQPLTHGRGRADLLAAGVSSLCAWLGA